MKPTLVDSSVLLDIATQDAEWFVWSSRALETAANESVLVINALIYAEVSVRYRKIEDLENAIPSNVYRREPLPFEAAFLAGKAFLKYRRRGGRRTSSLPDFYIGAHAAVADFRVLTRDPRRYRMYFPTVELIAPPPKIS
jgi:predicted nucleic acid-binding protein